jgi:murein DD-endopeptidase MepM/ murein hydrolase activator NlpD
MHAVRWLSAPVSLAVSLILSLSPLVLTPVTATPPETNQEASESSDIVPASGTISGSPLEANTSREPDTEDQLVADVAPRDRANGDDGSVRLRGVEAPVQLEQQEAQGADLPQENDKLSDKPETREQKDPGDGPIPKQQEPARKSKPDRRQLDVRIWPMPAESYTFTQEFGCVPQLGSLYFPGEGCPANAPVIHTGVDLAAPEGTPFYAAASGWVTLADYDRPTADANTRIIIQHDGRNEGYATDYLHWVASYVEEGDYVHAGDPIGEVGNVGFSTGPHLHFSVTDLDTGQHVDPLRWLPDEPGLEGYVSRMPNARLRLPPGTTAGQPESADPSPPPPAVKKDVPKSPSENSKRGATPGRRNERTRTDRRAASEDPAANDAKRSDNKKSRDGAASKSATDESTTDVSPNDATGDRNRSRGQDRTQERNTSDAPPEDAAIVDDRGSSDSQANSSKNDRRGNQETSKDASRGGKENGSQDSGGRAARDTTSVDSSGPDEQGGQHDRNADRQNPDQRQHNGGGHQGNGERKRKA